MLEHMNRIRVFIVAFLVAMPMALAAQENDLCFWNAVSMKKDSFFSSIQRRVQFQTQPWGQLWGENFLYSTTRLW